MHTWQNSRWEGSTQNTPIQQSPKTESKYNMSNGRLDHANRSDTPQNMIMKSGQSCSKSETKTRLGQISHRSERLGIDT